MTGRRSPDRLATFIVGGIIAVAGIIAVGLGGAAALATPDYSRMGVEIPESVTSIAVETQFTNVYVYGGGTSGKSSAQFWTRGSTILGTLPQVSVQIRGTQALVTIQDEERELAWGVGMGNLELLLGPDQRLDSLTVSSGSGYLQVLNPNTTQLDVTTNSSAGITLVPATSAVALHGSGQFMVTTASQQPWNVVKANWFDPFVAQWWAQNGQRCTPQSDGSMSCVQATAAAGCAEGPGNGPGICVTIDPTAQRTIDVSDVAQGSWVEIRPTNAG